MDLINTILAITNLIKYTTDNRHNFMSSGRLEWTFSCGAWDATATAHLSVFAIRFRF